MADTPFASFTVALDDGAVGARLFPAAAPGTGTLLVLAHGAGAPQSSGFMVDYAGALAARGLDVVTFNFPYMEARRKLPDPGPALEACYAAVIGQVRARPDIAGHRFVIGGKSMGGRIASQVVAHDQDTAEAVDGLVLLGYPLHPPGKPQQLRSRHLPGVRRPMLVVQGERDVFGTPAELQPVLSSLAPAPLLFVVDGGDHSFKVPGRSDREVPAELIEAIASFIFRVHRRGPLAG